MIVRGAAWEVRGMGMGSRNTEEKIHTNKKKNNKWDINLGRKYLYKKDTEKSNTINNKYI